MKFPHGFLWGASTAAHQIEGGNTNSDWWQREHGHLPGPAVEEPSGDAADSYHRYAEDMSLLAEAGLTSYRFSIEWARIEPEEGFISRAALGHYRRMVATAVDLGLVPVVTLHHFSNPVWFARAGGWKDPGCVEKFARYVGHVLPVLEQVDLVCTINEPNMVAVLSDPERGFPAVGLPAGDPVVTGHLIAAHRRAVQLLQAEGKKAGWSVATQAYQGEPGAEAVAEEYGTSREHVFLDACAGDDWVGVQAYTRTRIGLEGPLPIADDAERTLTGWEYYPQAIGDGIRNSWKRNGLPIYVTENGIATADDSRRIDYTRGALEAVACAIDDGIDIRGYLHWSALDNYEWGSYRPTFGLISWDPKTFERQPKPSLAWLGGIARANALPASAPAD